MHREGLLIERPIERLSEDQIGKIHRASLELLKNPGLICFNEEAAAIFADGGAYVSSAVDAAAPPHRIVQIPERVVLDALDSTPSSITLGARDPANTLVTHGDEPRVYFVSGSETNTCLDIDFETYVKKSDPATEIRVPSFTPRRGTVEDLCRAAHLCEHLETLDAFIRNVNIQDDDITEGNKDVNKVFASLDNTTKHVMIGLTNIGQLDNVLRMATIIAGGPGRLRKNPLLSFITCLVKSPLQFVDDTTQSFIEICRRGLPVVVSSSPQAGTTAPVKEAGIIAQINAEVLAGIMLGQLVRRGTPIMYGSVPVMTRMDSLADSYGAVETSQFNIDCVQLARFYKIPNYSTSGVCDPKIPGQQSSIERLFSNILVTLSGPQYLHCAYGLLDCNSVFCPLQAVLDDAHFRMIQFFLRPARIDDHEIDEAMKQIRDISSTSQKLYIRHIRKVLRSGILSPPYPFEGEGDADEVFARAFDRMNELMARPVNHIDRETTAQVFREIPGLLPRLNRYDTLEENNER